MNIRTRSGCGRASTRSGFSLTELLIVVAVATLLSSIGVASIVGRLPNYRLEQASWQLIGDLRSARMEAVAKSTRATITMNTSQRSYSVWVDANRNGSVDTGERTERSLADIPGVQMYCYPNSGTFLPQGTFESSYLYWYIAVWNSAAGYRYVYIFPSGQIDPYNPSGT
jgi:prepilin-type N-terminal cleavage/methylation domain-containing protein